MKKKFKLEDLDCANCAAKMEEAIKKIPGVNDANVSFMTQKMTVDAEDDKFDDIMKEVVSVCAKVEPSAWMPTHHWTVMRWRRFSSPSTSTVW